jgi:hypothetical protein
MKKYFLMTVLFFSVAVFAADNGKWTGYIGDSHCGSSGTGDGHASCAKKCIGEGYKPMFIVGDKAYAISNPDKVSKYIGDKVTISGDLVGDSIITIKKISK